MPEAATTERRNSCTISVMILGPSLHAVSGIAAHLRHIFSSDLAIQIKFDHFVVGSEGHSLSRIGRYFYLIASPFRFAWCVATAKPDVIHVNTSLDQKGFWRDLVFVAIAKSLRRKVVLQMHGGPEPEIWLQTRSILAPLFRWYVRSPDVIVVISETQLASYRRLARKTELIPNAVPSGATQITRVITKRDQPIRLIYVGRLVFSKGVREIVDVLALLSKRQIDFKFVFVGDGEEVGWIRRQILASGLNHRVELAGKHFGETLEEYWKQADIFVFPTHREQLPYALLEGMAFGVVPVATRVGAIPDVVQDRVHGVLVDVGDIEGIAAAIERLQADRCELLEFATRAQQRVAQAYSIERLGRDLMNVYREVHSVGSACRASSDREINSD